MLSDVQQIAAATAALVASPCVLTSAILALAEKLLFAFIDICKWQAERHCMKGIRKLKLLPAWSHHCVG
jgi:hypothetical protein